MNDFDEWEERLKPTMTLKPDLDELGKQTPPSFNLVTIVKIGHL